MIGQVDVQRVEGLAATFKGAILCPGAPGYEDGRLIYNGLVDKRPALIARCTTPADVATAIAFARDGGLPWSRIMRRVSPRTRSPAPAVWFTALAAVAFTVFVPYSTIAAGVATTNYTDGDVLNKVPYYYVVAATAAGLESANSDEASATPQNAGTLLKFK